MLRYAMRLFFINGSRLVAGISLLLIGFLLPVRIQAAEGSLNFARCSVYGIPMQVITVNLKDRSLLVTPAISLGAPAKQKTFVEFQEKYNSLAQVTGTFYSIESGQPIGDIVIRGKRVCNSVGIGSALVIKPNNEAAIIDDSPDKSVWKGYESVMQGGLRLVRDGLFAYDPENQGFHDQFMQRLTSRIVVGLLPKNRLALIKTGDVMFPQLAYALIELGCTDAMALDGGTSSAMAFMGKCTANTGRRLSNVLMVVRREKAAVAPPKKAVPNKASEKRNVNNKG